MPTGKIRTGARSWGKDIQHACRMSRMPGFRTAITTILGPDTAEPLLLAWDDFCVLVDAAVGADNFFNQIDATADVAGNEDIGPA